MTVYLSCEYPIGTDVVLVRFEPNMGWSWERVVQLAESGRAGDLNIIGPVNGSSGPALSFVDDYNPFDPEYGITWGVLLVLERDDAGQVVHATWIPDPMGNPINWLRPELAQNPLDGSYEGHTQTGQSEAWLGGECPEATTPTPAPTLPETGAQPGFRLEDVEIVAAFVLAVIIMICVIVVAAILLR
jgi:hypothetical protein